jgi:cell wall-associated NlpC family hydrolase
VSDWKKISSMGDLEKGDLIFFWNSAKTKVGHVGIYIGGGRMIDASSGNGKVVKRSCTTSYWKKMFVCGRRPW